MGIEAAEILCAIAEFVDVELLEAFDPEMGERLTIWRGAVDLLSAD